MDEVLLFLLQSGIAKKPIRITTAEIGRSLGMTQQNASKRLQKLERDGLIKRSSLGITITKDGLETARKEYAILKECLEGSFFELRGTLRSGLGEGKYYLSVSHYRDRIKKALNFEPYPGTLNIELDESDRWKRDVLLAKSIFLPSFEADGRFYGGLYLHPCSIANKVCAIIFPERTHHKDNIIEIISPIFLRKYLRKKDGDKVVIKVGDFL